MKKHGLKTIVPDGATVIEKNAFSWNSDLAEVIIPDSVREIGEAAFMCCTGLTKLLIPDSVAIIGDTAFGWCSGLKKLHISDGVTSIGDSAFAGCSGLKRITVSKKNKTYDSRNDCNAVIETSSNTLLVGCNNTVIPDGVTSIGNHAFGCCLELTEIRIPDGVTRIGEQAFFGCSGLTKLNIPEGVTEIGDSAFWGCTSLMEVHIPETVTKIGACAFLNCTGLTEVHIPATMTNIGHSAFAGCSSLLSITVASANKFFDSRNDCNAIVETSSNTLLEGSNNTVIPDGVTSIGDSAFDGRDLTELSIPEGVKSIGEGAFALCTGLTEIHIPDGVTSIGRRAFVQCGGVSEIHIPKGVTIIGDNTFNQCSGLTEIQIPDGVESIGDSAFFYCGALTEISIPESVKKIGKEAFKDCSSLTEIHIPDNLKEIGDSAFDGCDSLRRVFSSKGLDLSRTGLSDSVDIVYEDRHILVVPDGIKAFGNGPNETPIINLTQFPELITRIVLPDGMEYIGSKAFRDFESLRSIDIPNGVVSIGEEAFFHCAKLKRVVFPPSLKKISSRAFARCYRLEDVEFNDGLEEIGSEAFAMCSLRNITLPSSIKEPLPYATFKKETPTRSRVWHGAAFKDCYNIKSVSIPRKLSFVKTGWYDSAPVERSSTSGLVRQIGLLNPVFIPVEYGRRYLGWNLKDHIMFRPKVDVVIRRMDIPKTTSILLDLAYDGYHMICKVSIALLESISHYEYENGQYGSCRLDDPFQEHLAGVYLSDNPEVKSWKSCKSLDDGIKYGLDRYEEELGPVLAGARKIGLQDLWP